MSVFKNSEAIANLVELDLSENKGFNLVKIAKKLNKFKRLTTLQLCESVTEPGKLDFAVFEKLKDCTSMIKRLDLKKCRDGNWLANVISNCSLFKNLVMLNLASTELNEEGIQSLVNSPFLGGL